MLLNKKYDTNTTLSYLVVTSTYFSFKYGAIGRVHFRDNFKTLSKVRDWNLSLA